jgi:3-oxoacyl-[acyl-carrier protein] reductase
MELNMKNRVAVVTGAAQGIGKEIAGVFCKEGCKVALLDVNEEKLAETCKELQASGVEVYGAVCDITDEGSVSSTVSSIVDRFGTIDFVVNNAGITGPAPIHELSYESWRKVMDVNLNGAFLVSKYVFPVMMKARYGSIVNIGSFAGKRGTLFGDNTSYSTSKAGIIGFSKALAMEGARYGIRVNAVCPGIVETDMLKAHPPERRAELANYVMLKRLAQPKEIADVVVFLCSERASHITAEALDVNGGLYID